jgi:RNA polymerase-binding protein DksA
MSRKRRISLARYQKLLEAERQKLLQADRELHERTRWNGQNPSEVTSDYDDLPADIALQTYEREKDYALGRQLREMLERVDYALSKIEAGTYGICEACGRNIAVERLETLPHAELCIQCQHRLEKA